MFSNRVASTALAVGCLVAAAAGGYFATLRSVSPTASLAGSTNPIPLPVQEAEAVHDQLAVAPKPSESITSGSTLKRPATGRTVQPQARHDVAPRPAKATDSQASSDRVPPSGAATAAPVQTPNSVSSPAALPAQELIAPITRNEDHGVQEPTHQAEPAQPILQDLVLAQNSVIGLQVETPVSSERAHVEDRVEARVARDVRVGDALAVPAGSRAIGSVVQVERGGKFKDRARLGIAFHTLVLADGTRVPIRTETIYREGSAPGNPSAAKVGGGATVGAIIGAIIGGGKGAAIGATAGGGAGAAAVMAGDRDAAALRPGEPITVRLTQPATVTVEQR